MVKETKEEKKKKARLEKLGASKQIADYTLPSEHKLKRAMLTIGTKATDENILTEYDRNGGLILETVKTKGGKEYKVVPRGTFYDFTKGVPRVKKEDKEDKKK